MTVRTVTPPDCVVCDGVYGCEFCPRGWSPSEERWTDTEWEEADTEYDTEWASRDEPVGEASCPA